MVNLVVIVYDLWFLIKNNYVKWNNINYEDGLDKEDALELDEHGITPIKQLIFNREQYQQVFKEYLVEYL